MRLNYIVIAILVAIVAASGSLITIGGMKWYKTLVLPPWMPPPQAFSAAWTTIFVLAAISLAIFWNSPERDLHFREIISLFVANGVLNVGWSFLFFGLHLINLSILDAIVLVAATIRLAVVLRPLSKISSLLLVPYACWAAFAVVLNFAVWLAN